MGGLKNIGEFGLIDRIKSMFPAPEGVTGIGDDCAVIPQQDGFETLVSTDMLVENSHFIRSHVKPYQLGWKSAAVNFSDIAAMGGTPVCSFLSLALPPDVTGEWMDEFIRGYKDISDRYGFALLGGDTTSSREGISICVTVMGRAPAGTSRRRNDAGVGDNICVTGPLGDSGLGLELILSGKKNLNDVEAALVERHYLPMPRIDEGMKLSSTPGVHAMMDISDGVASDLLHILASSGVRAVVDCATIPLSREAGEYCACAEGVNAKACKAALCGGEDYELLFTATDEALAKLGEKGVPYYKIGRIVEENSGDGASPVSWESVPEGLDPDGIMGFRHF